MEQNINVFASFFNPPAPQHISRAIIKPRLIVIIFAYAGIKSTPQKHRAMVYEQVFRTCTLDYTYQNQPNGTASLLRGPTPRPPSFFEWIEELYNHERLHNTPAIKPLWAFRNQPKLTMPASHAFTTCPSNQGKAQLSMRLTHPAQFAERQHQAEAGERENRRFGHRNRNIHNSIVVARGRACTSHCV